MFDAVPVLHHLVDLAGVEAGGLEVGQSVAHAVAVVEAVAAPGLIRVPFKYFIYIM